MKKHKHNWVPIETRQEISKFEPAGKPIKSLGFTLQGTYIIEHEDYLYLACKCGAVKKIKAKIT